MHTPTAAKCWSRGRAGGWLQYKRPRASRRMGNFPVSDVHALAEGINNHRASPASLNNRRLLPNYREVEPSAERTKRKERATLLPFDDGQSKQRRLSDSPPRIAIITITIITTTTTTATIIITTHPVSPIATIRTTSTHFVYIHAPSQPTSPLPSPDRPVDQPTPNRATTGSTGFVLCLDFVRPLLRLVSCCLSFSAAQGILKLHGILHYPGFLFFEYRSCHCVASFTRSPNLEKPSSNTNHGRSLSSRPVVQGLTGKVARITSSIPLLSLSSISHSFSYFHYPLFSRHT